MWLINLTILTFCLVKILFYGEPYIVKGTKASSNLESRKKLAETQFQSNKDPLIAFESYSSCLTCFDIKLPKTKLERSISIIWQFIRMIMYGTIGKLIAKKTNFYKSRTDVLESAKELALVYHRLNQISLTSNVQEQNGLLMSLYAINMTEIASGIMEPDQVAEVYLAGALRAKKGFLKFLSRYDGFIEIKYLALMRLLKQILLAEGKTTFITNGKSFRKQVGFHYAWISFYFNARL